MSTSSLRSLVLKIGARSSTTILAVLVMLAFGSLYVRLAGAAPVPGVLVVSVGGGGGGGHGEPPPMTRQLKSTPGGPRSTSMEE